VLSRGVLPRGVRNALALMLSTGGTSLLGLAFWGLAAHLYATDTVGRASAVISAMAMLSGIAQMDLNPLYPRYLPQAGPRTLRMVLLGYGTSTIVGLLLAIGFVVLGFGHKILPAGFGPGTIFAVAVVFWVVFTIQDSVLTSLRATMWVPVENIAFAVVKLALLFAFVGGGVLGIFLGWSLPVVVAIVVVNAYIFSRLIPNHERSSGGMSRLPPLRTMMSFAVSETLSNQSTIVARALMPILVVDRLGAAAGAYFYIPWLVATNFPLFIWYIATTAVVEVGFDRAKARRHLIRAIRLAALIVIPAGILLVTVGPEVLNLVKPGYGTHGATLLRLTTLMTVLSMPTLLYLTLVWIEGRRVWKLAILEGASNIVAVGGSLLLFRRFGIDAPGVVGVITWGANSAALALPTRRRWRALSARDERPA
jgi:O-antigen/teichoic acid export membrane protein